MVLYAANWTHDKSLQTESRKDVLQSSPFCIRQDVEEGRALQSKNDFAIAHSILPRTPATSQTSRQGATFASWLQPSLKLLFVSITSGRTWFAAFRLNWPVTFKRPEDIRRPPSGASGASKLCKVTKWQATYRPLTRCCSPWIRLSSLQSQTAEHTSLSLILAWRKSLRW